MRKVVRQDFSERLVRRAFAELLLGMISLQKLMIKSSAECPVGFQINFM